MAVNMIPPLSSASAAMEAQGARKGAKPGENRPVAQSAEKVEISDTSKTLQVVKEAIDRLPDVRIQRVMEIKERIKKNDYPLENRLARALDLMAEAKVVG